MDASEKINEWVDFTLQSRPENRVTDVWEVITKPRGAAQTVLGHVKWFGHWRKHVFFPLALTVYDPKCLRDIANFCEKMTKSRVKERR